MAPHLTFLHGQPGAGSDFDGVRALLPAGVDVLAEDRPGYGDRREGPGDFEAGARDVVRRLDAAGVTRTVLVGHSYGGGVALVAAARCPERVDGVVLLASVGPGALTGWDRLLAAPVTGEVCAVAAWWLTPWVARARLRRIARRHGAEVTRQRHVNWDVWASARHGHGHVWRTFLVEQRALVRNLGQVGDAASRVRCPVLVVADEADTLVPVATSRGLAATVPDAELHLVTGVGHHLPRRAPQVVADVVTGFSARLADRVQRSGT